MELTPERKHRSYPKGKTQKQIKAKADRAEAKVKKAVRAACVRRDQDCCRLLFQFTLGYVTRAVFGGCDGRLEWAHMHSHRRSQTRGQAADKRHTTADSLMLCRFHHDQYDGRARPRLLITKLTRQGADGPLKFTRAKA